ncbi:MAG: BrnA antitoxin family protein [Ramlibacter sp.]
MTGSRKEMTRKEILEALKRPPPGGDYVWDGIDEDDRPATAEELRAGIAAARKRGRPAGSTKESTTIRIDQDVLAAFRASGPGWQSRMNAALRDWLKAHPQH